VKEIEAQNLSVQGWATPAEVFHLLRRRLSMSQANGRVPLGLSAMYAHEREAAIAQTMKFLNYSIDCRSFVAGARW